MYFTEGKNWITKLLVITVFLGLGFALGAIYCRRSQAERGNRLVSQWAWLLERGPAWCLLGSGKACFPAGLGSRFLLHSCVSGRSSGPQAMVPSFLPMNIQDSFPLGLTGWISLQSKRHTQLDEGPETP